MKMSFLKLFEVEILVVFVSMILQNKIDPVTRLVGLCFDFLVQFFETGLFWKISAALYLKRNGSFNLFYISIQ